MTPPQPPFATNIKVRFSDVDRAGIAYYPRGIHWLHVALRGVLRAVLRGAVRDGAREGEPRLPRRRPQDGVRAAVPVRRAPRGPREPRARSAIVRRPSTTGSSGSPATSACARFVTVVCVRLDSLSRRRCHRATASGSSRRSIPTGGRRAVNARAPAQGAAAAAGRRAPARGRDRARRRSTRPAPPSSSSRAAGAASSRRCAPRRSSGRGTGRRALEWLRVVAAGRVRPLALPRLRVSGAHVPRVYRMVCGSLRSSERRGATDRRRIRSASRPTTSARATRPSAARR